MTTIKTCVEDQDLHIITYAKRDAIPRLYCIVPELGVASEVDNPLYAYIFTTGDGWQDNLTDTILCRLDTSEDEKTEAQRIKASQFFGEPQPIDPAILADLEQVCFTTITLKQDVPFTAFPDAIIEVPEPNADFDCFSEGGNA